MYYTTKLISQPENIVPVTNADLDRHLVSAPKEYTTFFNSTIETVTILAEEYTNRSFKLRQYETAYSRIYNSILDYPDWPAGEWVGADLTIQPGALTIPKAGFHSIDANQGFQYLTRGATNYQTWDRTNYTLVKSSSSYARVIPKRDTIGFPYNLEEEDSIKLLYQVGYNNDANMIPHAIRKAIIYWVKAIWNREDQEDMSMPKISKDLLAHYKVVESIG